MGGQRVEPGSGIMADEQGWHARVSGDRALEFFGRLRMGDIVDRDVGARFGEA